MTTKCGISLAEILFRILFDLMIVVKFLEGTDKCLTTLYAILTTKFVTK